MHLFSVHCAADFVNGTDNFNGTALDTTTWFIPDLTLGGIYTQNNGLTLGNPPPPPTGPRPMASYVTNAPVVPVGGSVWARVRMLDVVTPITYFQTGVLSLTTAPTGNPMPDSLTLELYDDLSPLNSQALIMAGETQIVGNNGTATAQKLSQTPAEDGITSVFQIERLSGTLVRFSLFSETQNPTTNAVTIHLTSTTQETYFTSNEDMYVRLMSLTGNVLFENVTINHPLALNATTLPEPSIGAAILAVVAALYRRRSNRHSAGFQWHSRAAKIGGERSPNIGSRPRDPFDLSNVRHITNSEAGVEAAREMLHDLLNRELPALASLQQAKTLRAASA